MVSYSEKENNQGEKFMAFKEVKLEDIKLDTYKTIAEDWLVLSAGDEKGYGCMTVSWGQTGSLWKGEGLKPFAGMPVATVYVRPQRNTKKFIDEQPLFTLSAFNGERKNELGFLGKRSGREFADKFAACGMTPLFIDGSVAAKEAHTVFVCRKLYTYKIEENGFFYSETISKNYPNKDFHQAYIGEIVKIYQRTED